MKRIEIVTTLMSGIVAKIHPSQINNVEIVSSVGKLADEIIKQNTYGSGEQL